MNIFATRKTISFVALKVVPTFLHLNLFTITWMRTSVATHTQKETESNLPDNLPPSRPQQSTCKNETGTVHGIRETNDKRQRPIIIW